VAQDEERVGVVGAARAQDLYPVAAREREPEITQFSVDPSADSLLRELRPDRARGVERARFLREFQLRVVR